jgi:hypothetical protein
VIRIKSNANLQRLADELHPASVPSDATKAECYYEESEYQAKSWSKPRKVIIQSVRPAGELFFTHSFFVTNLIEALSPKDVVNAYMKRGTMENYIKEAKNCFGLDKMNSHSFQVNESKMMLSLLAYNLTNWLCTLCFPEGQKSIQIETVRTRLIKRIYRLNLDILIRQKGRRRSETNVCFINGCFGYLLQLARPRRIEYMGIIGVLGLSQ